MEARTAAAVNCSPEKMKNDQRPYKGIRMRKWGNLRHGRLLPPGPSARLNFPELLASDGAVGDLSSASIRKKAIEVGARVDAETSCTSVHVSGTRVPGSERKACWFQEKPDLNVKPEPEEQDGECWP
ncbi:hypothetical protein E3N88_20259 [Mikania micrantha]|uniref:Uncharacterized protein n=1 Tax=Mikania micrantha TaxID=192012 RepID=A0A5N6NGH1_9ASTR|nr:hypothetical protein E3N88_20259 [Mikania micrantha]